MKCRRLPARLCMSTDGERPVGNTRRSGHHLVYIQRLTRNTRPFTNSHFTAFTAAHPTRNVWRFSLSETLFQSATLKHLCHFLCHNVASLLYAVGEQTLGVGFVLVCEMQVLVKGLSISARHRNMYLHFSVNTWLRSKRNTSPKTSCAIRIGSHLKVIYIMVCNQASDLTKQPSEFIASCYIRMYVYMCV